MRIVVENAFLEIPDWVTDLSSFRRWATSEEFPEKGRISHLKGKLWVDLSMETLIHNKVKFCVCWTLQASFGDQEPGELLIDRMRLTHPEVGLSTEPDGMYYSDEALERQRVQLVRGDESIEVIGSPEMVLEVVSNSSEEKDTVVLMDLYWKAGVQEYWLIDPRGEDLRFDLFVRGAKGFKTSRKQGGWVKSQVFQKSFRLIRTGTDPGRPKFKLEMR